MKSQITLITIFALSLASSANALKAPELFGIYAKVGDELVELRPDKESITLELPSALELYVYDKSSSQISANLTLQRMFYIRNKYWGGMSYGSRQKTEPIKNWKAMQNKAILGRVKPWKGESEILIWVSNEKLEAGVYSVRSNNGKQLESFFVNQKSVMDSLESSAHCLDWYTFMGNLDGEYRPCATAIAQGTQGGRSDVPNSQSSKPFADSALPLDLKDLRFLTGKWCHKAISDMKSEFDNVNGSTFRYTLISDSGVRITNIYDGQLESETVGRYSAIDMRRRYLALEIRGGQLYMNLTGNRDILSRCN